MLNPKKNKIENIIKLGLYEILNKEAKYMIPNAIITVCDVCISPDLSLANINLSIYAKNREIDLNPLKSNQNKIKYLLGKKIGKKIRRIPELKFYVDHTHEHMNHIDNILNGNIDSPIKI